METYPAVIAVIEFFEHKSAAGAARNNVRIGIVGIDFELAIVKTFERPPENSQVFATAQPEAVATTALENERAVAAVRRSWFVAFRAKGSRTRTIRVSQ